MVGGAGGAYTAILPEVKKASRQLHSVRTSNWGSELSSVALEYYDTVDKTYERPSLVGQNTHY